ncbi:MAG: cellulase family glycosylhydrolase [Flavobacteriaceae bacterium]|nr:cellulase family glycosylhydrolase [Flavobacteriaceae bacterium]
MEAQYMQVSGKNVKDANGNTVTLRGINYPILDQGEIDFNTNSFQYYIDEFAKTGANTIRIPWYTNGQHWRDSVDFGAPGTLDGYIANGRLAALIDYCFLKNLYVVLDIHDITCTNDWAKFNGQVMNFWKSPNVVNLINTHQSKLIINLANEFGEDGTWGWGGTMAQFTTNYKNAVADLRALNIKVPIMIDAPNCGQHSSPLVAASADILSGDSLANLIFSTHTYWYGYADTNAQIDAKMNEIIGSPQCFILGEVAKRQDNDDCFNTVDITATYQRILTTACTEKMGWLAWTYSLDCASQREMTPDGNFANLTVFGDDIVNNPTYGLKVPSCGEVLQTSEVKISGIKVFPNPNGGEFTIQTESEIIGVELFDQSARKVSAIKEISKNKYRVNTNDGVYLLQVKTKTGNFSEQLIINN